MQSRKFNAAALGSALVGLVQMVGGLLILMGYDSATVQNTCNAISVAVGGLFGLVVVGVMKEDAAAKSNPATPPIQNAVERATQTLEQRNAARIDDLIGAAIKRLEGMVRK